VEPIRVAGALICLSVIVCGCGSGSSTTATVTSGPSSVDQPIESSRTRTFHVRVKQFGRGERLTIGLHPDRTAVLVHVVGTSLLEICPASLDGGVGPPVSSSPSWTNFDSCRTPDAAHDVSLASSGAEHVAFAIRSPRLVRTAIDVTVTYVAVDSFLLVIPPTVEAASAEVAFVPHSAQVGAQAFILPNYLNSSTVATVEQKGHPVLVKAPCGFGSEIDCVDPVTPNLPVTVSISGRSTSSARLAVYVSWP
jgi:hypothetical protein